MTPTEQTIILSTTGKVNTGLGFFSGMTVFLTTHYHGIAALCTIICTMIAITSFVQSQIKRRKEAKKNVDKRPAKCNT